MSKKIKKQVMLIFLVLLMFFVIPMSFASDVSDDGNVELSVDDADSIDSVNDIVSINDETEAVLNIEDNLTDSQDGILGEDGYSGIIYVSKTGNNNNDGSEGAPVLTIKKAIALATSASNVEHKIIIGEGTYKENSLTINSDLTIVGNNAVIDVGATSKNILAISGGNVSVSGITFANVKRSTLDFFSDYHAITISNANVVIDDCVFDNNNAYDGPAIYISDAGANNIVNITNNVFKKQTASRDGIIYSSSSRIYLENNTMVDCGSSDIYVSGGEILSELNLVISGDATIYLGDSVEISALLTDDSGNNIDGGKITFTANGASIKESSVSSGTATASFTPEAVGNYTISGEYNLASNVNVYTALIVVDKMTYNGTIYVSKDGNDRNDGSPEAPVLTIAKAIELATSEDNVDHKIIIGDGTYAENSLSVSSDLTIVGNNAVIDASPQLLQYYNILTINGGNVAISGVTFSNVNTPIIGSDYHAIIINYATVVIDNCVFDSNTAKDGPAIYISDAGTDNVINITNNVFKKQTARSDGIIYSSNSRIYLENNTMVDCNSLDIYVSGGEILSELNLVIGENATIYLGSTVEINAVLTDDSGNTIDGGTLTLTANCETIKESSVSSGTASASFTPEDVGNYTISGEYSLASNVNVETALIVVNKMTYNGTIYVSKEGNDENDGSPEAPVLTIARAIELATSEDNVVHMIIIDNGTYEENSLSVSSDLTIVGNNTTIDALKASKNILVISGGNVSVSGITFANVDTNLLTLTDYHAIAIENANVVIDDCVFDNNAAYYGPAIHISNVGGTVVISNNLFKKQSARFNGIIYSSNSNIELYNNTMVDCSSALGNADIYMVGGEILSEVKLTIGENATIYLGDKVTIGAVLTDDNGNLITGGQITFTANGETIAQEDADGDISTEFTPLEVGNYTISGKYNLASNVNVETALIVVDKSNYTGIIYVSKDGDDRNDGSPEAPVLTIAKAIELATSEDNVVHMIIIDNGTYEENSLSVSSDLTIVGNNTTIDALKASKNILVISGGNVSVSGVTFANVDTNLVTLTDYHAIAIENANVVIDDCVFDSNSAYYGPAIHISDVNGTNTVVISNNLFKKQSARFNGIIYSSNSNIELYNNTMVDCSSLLGNAGINMVGGEILSEVKLTIGENTSIRLGQKAHITALLTDDNGNLITGGTIILTANGETIAQEDADGDVSTEFTPEAVGNYTISGEYSLASNVNVETALIVVNESYKGIIYVSKDGSDDNDGSQESPVLTIAKAIEIATFNGNTDHMIIIDNGTYKEDGLKISSDLTIVGNNTIIDSGDNILDISGGKVSVSGITFANVFELINFGAVKIQNADVVIDNCVFENNTAGTGAAIYVSDVGGDNSVVITNNLFKDQTSLSMGIIFSTNSRIYLENNTMEDCSSYLLGSDIYISGGEILSEVNMVIEEDATIYLGESVHLTVTLTDDSGNTIVGGKVTLTANDKEIKELYVLTGDVSTDYVPESFGNYTISGKYSLASDVNVDTAFIQMKEYTGVIYVSKRGSDNNCGNQNLPVLTIEKAIELATSESNVAHTIIIGQGTYKESRLEIDSDLKIIGNNAVVDASYVGKVFDITGGNVEISGIKFINVLAVLNVGAIKIQNANVVIDNCVFENNTALRAPAIYVSDVDGDNVVVITNNKFIKQTALLRGIIYSTDSNIYLENNTMVDCNSYILGSDIYVDDGEILSEVNLIISENATIKLGEKVTIDAVLTDDSGNSISGGKITLTANGDKIAELNLLDGDVSTTFTPKAAGDYIISGEYNLASDVNVQTALITVTEYTGVIYVSKDGSDKNDGSPEAPVLTIKRAIELATSERNVEHTIIIDEGTYREDDLVINSDLKIVGNNAIIRGTDNILDIRGGYVDVSGITFANVIELLDAGAVKIQNASVVIDNCVFEDNIAFTGSAIYISNAGDENVVVISNNLFKRQTSLFGGIISSTNSSIYLENNTMEDCTTYVSGSDIYISGGEILSEVNLIIGENKTIRLGDTVTIDAVLTDDSGNHIYGGTITLTANGETIAEEDADNDVSTEFTPEEVGNYTISGEYSLATDVNVETAFIVVNEQYTGIIYVSKDGDDKNHGSSEDPVLTIAKAIELATSDINVEHTIIIDEGTYREDGLVINSDLKIIGNNTIIRGNDNILDIRGGNVDVSGITFTNVVELLDTGAVKIQNASVIIDNCVFEDNTAFTGSAIYISDAGDENVVVITNNLFNRQTSLFGGIISSTNSSIYLENNTMEDCTTYVSGSDIYVDGGEILSEVNLVIERNKTVIVGYPTSLIVSLTDDSGNSIVGGKVTLTANDEVFDEVDINDDSVRAEFYPESVTNYTISGVYDLAEDINVQTANIEVIDDVIVFVQDVTKYYGGPERFVVVVANHMFKPIENKTVEITINGRTYEKTTDENGTASIGLNLNSGVYNVTSTVDNITINSTVTVLSTVEGNDLVKVFKNATPYTAVFKDSEGNYLAPGTLVQYNINGVMYYKQVGENGVAKLNINLPQGNYIITTMNLVTGENCANNVTVLPRITDNHDITKFYKNDTQYTVTLIGDDGNPVGAGEVVTFNINGVFYNCTTNESGIAKLNINLPPGDYIITGEYKGCKVSNNITVKPVLFADDLNKTQGGPEQFVATLLDGQGKPYEGQIITFNINGVFYNKTTDSNGQAKLNINLPAGEYIITSSYNGINVANKVTVKA